jgi:hypothetical protein
MSSTVKEFRVNQDLTQVGFAELSQDVLHANDVGTIENRSQPTFTRRKLRGFAAAMQMTVELFIDPARPALRFISVGGSSSPADIPPGFTVQRCGPNLAILAMGGESHQSLSWFAGLPAVEQERLQAVHTAMQPAVA